MELVRAQRGRRTLVVFLIRLRRARCLYRSPMVTAPVTLRRMTCGSDRDDWMSGTYNWKKKYH
eukprot:9859108-Lingulodinium_polyedra.AAC.1